MTSGAVVSQPSKASLREASGAYEIDPSKIKKIPPWVKGMKKAPLPK